MSTLLHEGKDDMVQGLPPPVVSAQVQKGLDDYLATKLLGLSQTGEEGWRQGRNI